MNDGDGELPLVRRAGKSEAAFRTISEVAEDLDVPQHVLRFWEGKFPQVKPLKRGGGRRYYRPDDVVLLRRIRDLLYSEGYTIKGVLKLLKDGGGAVREPAAATTSIAEVDVVGEGENEPEVVHHIRDPDPPGEPLSVADDEPGADPGEEITQHGDCLPDGTRRELKGLLAELEQLRGLLQPR